MIKSIKTFVINLEERTERKCHITNQFKEKNGFDMQIVKAIKDPIGAIGLWKTLKEIIHIAHEENHSFVLICEDDHNFTNQFDYQKLIKSINKAQQLNADVLLGGVSYFQDCIPLSDDIFWLSGFTGFQFAIIFKNFYSRFTSLQLENHENIDIKIREISTNILCIYPFISVQKEFGYSDVTSHNGRTGVIDKYFKDTEERMSLLLRLKRYFEGQLDPKTNLNS